MITSTCSDAEFIFRLADLSAEEGELQSTLKPLAMPCRKKCTKDLCGWLMSMSRQAENTRGVVIV